MWGTPPLLPAGVGACCGITASLLLYVVSDTTSSRSNRIYVNCTFRHVRLQDICSVLLSGLGMPAANTCMLRAGAFLSHTRVSHLSFHISPACNCTQSSQSIHDGVTRFNLVYKSNPSEIASESMSRETGGFCQQMVASLT